MQKPNSDRLSCGTPIFERYLQPVHSSAPLLVLSSLQSVFSMALHGCATTLQGGGRHRERAPDSSGHGCFAAPADVDHSKRYPLPWQRRDAQPIVWEQLWSVGCQGMATNIAILEYVGLERGKGMVSRLLAAGRAPGGNEGRCLVKD